jgi:ABC-type multidrug transport system fused ATPase/permease subunit
MAGSTLFLFGSVAFLLYRFMQAKARNLSISQTNLGIYSSEKILEVLNSYRESLVRNRRGHYAQLIGNTRRQIAGASAEMSFMPYVSKYVIEIVIVVGAVTVSAIQFSTQDARHAVATLSVFLAASTRIAPAVLRLQQGMITVKSNLAQGALTLGLLEELSDKDLPALQESEIRFTHAGFQPSVSLKNVSFTYPGNTEPTLKNVSLEVRPGEVVAFVGPSGAGKTTLADIILGVIQSHSGNTLISGLEPLKAISTWPGAIGYVPQDIVIANEDIKSNVCLGFNYNKEFENHVLRCLKDAQLEEYVEGLPNGIDTQVGDRGTKLSGGQRQRLGIARALFTEPSLLVFDEATSALDGETEVKISSSIQSLKGKATVILIAHRLSTVKEADLVCYFDDGELIASGTFDFVRATVQDFDRQANLMGL